MRVQLWAVSVPNLEFLAAFDHLGAASAKAIF